jgi:hypothetical protein
MSLDGGCLLAQVENWPSIRGSVYLYFVTWDTEFGLLLHKSDANGGFAIQKYPMFLICLHPAKATPGKRHPSFPQPYCIRTIQMA